MSAPAGKAENKCKVRTPEACDHVVSFPKAVALPFASKFERGREASGDALPVIPDMLSVVPANVAPATKSELPPAQIMAGSAADTYPEPALVMLIPVTAPAVTAQVPAKPLPKQFAIPVQSAVAAAPSEYPVPPAVMAIEAMLELTGRLTLVAKVTWMKLLSEG